MLFGCSPRQISYTFAYSLPGQEVYIGHYVTQVIGNERLKSFTDPSFSQNYKTLTIKELIDDIKLTIKDFEDILKEIDSKITL